MHEYDAGGRKLYVGNLSFRTREEDLDHVFRQYGKITDMFIPLDTESGRNRGFGFITFGDPRDAEDAARAWDGREMDGRALTVNLARPRPPPRDYGYGGGRDYRDRDRGRY